MYTKGELSPDMTLSFDFSVSSGAFSFAGSGKVKNREIILSTGEGDSARETKIPIEKPPFLGEGLMYAASIWDEAGPKPHLSGIRPVITGQSPATVTVEKEEPITVMGNSVPAKKIAISFLGSSQSAWVGPDGNGWPREPP